MQFFFLNLKQEFSLLRRFVLSNITNTTFNRLDYMSNTMDDTIPHTLPTSNIKELIMLASLKRTENTCINILLLVETSLTKAIQSVIINIQYWCRAVNIELMRRGLDVCGMVVYKVEK
jgi:hypothetical protein